MHGIWLLTYLAAWLIVIFQFVVATSLISAIGRIHLKYSREMNVLVTDDGPIINVKMPQVEIFDFKGKQIKTSDFEGRQWLLLFLSTGCEPCDELLSQIQNVVRKTIIKTDMVIVLEANVQEVSEYIRKYKLTSSVIADHSSAFRTSLKINRAPYGLAIDESGFVRMKGVVNTGEQLEGLMLHRGIQGVQEWETDESLVITSPKSP